MKNKSKRASEKLHEIISGSINETIKIMRETGYNENVIANTQRTCFKCRDNAIAHIQNIDSKDKTYFNLIAIGKNKYIIAVEVELEKRGKHYDA